MIQPKPSAEQEAIFQARLLPRAYTTAPTTPRSPSKLDELETRLVWKLCEINNLSVE